MDFFSPEPNQPEEMEISSFSLLHAVPSEGEGDWGARTEFTVQRMGSPNHRIIQCLPSPTPYHHRTKGLFGAVPFIQCIMPTYQEEIQGILNVKDHNVKRQNKHQYLSYLLRNGKWSGLVVSKSLRPHGLYCLAPLPMGFSRQEYWSGLPFPFPGDLPDQRIEPGSPVLQADSLPSEPLELSDWESKTTMWYPRAGDGFLSSK